MNDTNTEPDCGTLLARVEALILELEREMGHLQARHPGVFAIASAWAQRYDVIIALAPPQARPDIESRLQRIGIRWGVMPGPRVTQEFTALGGHAVLAGRAPPDDAD